MASARGRMPKNKLPTAKSTSVPEGCSPIRSDKDYEAKERRYRAEDALRSINRAAEIKGDKQLMRDVKSLAKEQMNALKKI